MNKYFITIVPNDISTEQNVYNHMQNTSKNYYQLTITTEDFPVCVKQAVVVSFWGISGLYIYIYTYIPLDHLKVSHGQITFDAEGNDNPKSRYFSRKAHVPSSSSGITLGRGYDLKEKTEAKVYKDLVDSGISEATAKKFSKGAGLSGQGAKDYVKVEYLVNFFM